MTQKAKAIQTAVSAAFGDAVTVAAQELEDGTMGVSLVVASAFPKDAKIDDIVWRLHVLMSSSLAPEDAEVH